MKHRSFHPLGFAALGAFALVMASGLGGVGCTEVRTDAGADDGGVVENSEAGADTCGACVADQCAAAWALCLTDESCLAVRDCARSNDAASCACSAKDGGTGAGDRYRAFTMCSDARTCASDSASACASDCAARCSSATTTTPAPCDVPDASIEIDASVDAGDDAGPSDAGESDAGQQPAPSADGCASCAGSKCDSAKKACAIGSECALFLECAFACADSACVAACGDSHATGKVAAVELATCAEAGCEAECGL